MRLVAPLAVLTSLAAHGLLLAGALITWRPEPVPDQSPPEARFDIAAQPVPTSSARPDEAVGEATPVASAASQRVGGSAIPQSVAQASRLVAAAAPSVEIAADAVVLANSTRPATPPDPPDTERMAAVSVSGQRLVDAAIPQTAARASRPVAATAPLVKVAAHAVVLASSTRPATPPAPPDTERMAAVPVSGQRLVDAAIPQTAARASLPVDAIAPKVPVAGTRLTATVASGASARTNSPVAATAPPVPAAGTTIATADTSGTPAPAAAPDAISAPASTPQGSALPSLPPPSERGTAAFAWVGDQGALDPVSLAAIQAFMQPADLAGADANAGRLRDGIASTLSLVPCSRLQTSFDPETGSIELRGHLPEDALRAPVLAALQAQVGSALPIMDRLRVLPRPLCQVLGTIAGTGLAQSTEQETNPRIVGPDTFVRDYALAAGQRVVLDMTAPDYPAVIYVDYFDAGGNVLHMQPNDRVPAVLHPPKSALAVGRPAPGVPALELIVAPPYGQEIAVAYASSVPLYVGVRPTVEPAGPYLEFLAKTVAETRARTPDFKGEWVYFFVTTGP